MESKQPSQITGQKDKPDAFIATNKQHISHDDDGNVVYLTRPQWDIGRVVRTIPRRR